MIKARILYILGNYNKKLTVYDYMQEPVIVIKKGNIRDAKYVARPVFNCIRVGEDKKATNYLCKYRKYKVKHSKSRMINIVMMKKSEG